MTTAHRIRCIIVFLSILLTHNIDGHTIALAKKSGFNQNQAFVKNQDTITKLSESNGGQRALAWLESIKTFSAKFEQIDANGNSHQGLLYFQRPGHIRFEYSSETPLLIVSDGKTIAIADYELETVNRVPILSTPLRYLLGDMSKLKTKDAFIDVKYMQNQIFVTFVDPKETAQGQLTLVFEENTLRRIEPQIVLKGWYVKDGMNNLTEVILNDPKLNLSFNPRIFILNDEDVVSKTRRRR